MNEELLNKILESQKELIELLSQKDNTDIGFWGIIIALLINALIYGFSFWREYYIKNHQIKINRKSVIQNSVVELETQLYTKLHLLSLHTTPKDEKFLADINTTVSYVLANYLYISKEIYDISITFLDYFNNVFNDMSKKDFKFEEKKLDEFKKQFHK